MVLLHWSHITFYIPSKQEGKNNMSCEKLQVYAHRFIRQFLGGMNPGQFRQRRGGCRGPKYKYNTENKIKYLFACVLKYKFNTTEKKFVYQIQHTSVGLTVSYLVPKCKTIL